MAEESKELTVEEFTEGFRRRVADRTLGTNIKFAFDEGGIIFIDGRSTPNTVSNEDAPADVTLKMSLETLNKLHRKEVNGMTAFMSGKVKLEGDMMAAMKLDQILG
ncbi:MAG: SCP2 sterol-binding domain-containing protein [Blastocatellia bacterium]